MINVNHETESFDVSVNHDGQVTSVVQRVERPILRHKMYKDGKHLVTAGFIGLATVGGVVMMNSTAHADTTTTSASTTTATSASANNQAVTKVNVDSSSVVAAKSDAVAAGAKVSNSSGSTYSAVGSAQLNSATSVVASHYANETSELRSAETQAKNSNATSAAVTAMNNQVDSAVAAASAAGVATQNTGTVKVGSDGITTSQAQAQIDSASAQTASAVKAINSAVASTQAVKSAVTSGNAQIASAASAASATTGLKAQNTGMVNVSSVDQAKSAAASQVAALSNAIANRTANNAAVAAANKQLSDAASAAKAAGVAVKAGETKVYSSVAEAQKAASSEATVIADRALTATKSDNGGTINTSDIIQQLQIGNEDHATLTVSDVKGATVNKATKLFWGDLSTYAYTFVPSEKQGTITVTATYTGLTKSSYTDANGVTHQISKIVRIFKWDGSTTPAQTTGTVDGVKGVTLLINNQPQEGFGYYGGTVTETDQFYDQNGNLITIGPNAYISVSSLNSTTNGDSVTAGTVLGGGWSVKNGRVEGAKGVDNVVLKPIQGSSVRLDPKTGWLNAPEGNDNICVGFGDKTGKYSYVGNGGKTLYNLTLNGSGNWGVGDAILQGTGENGTVTSTDIWNVGYGWWDGSNGSAGNTQYFGAAAGKIDPGSTSFTVAFYTNGELLDSGNYWGTWAMVSTTIPSSPTTTYTPVALADQTVDYQTMKLKRSNPDPIDYVKYESGIKTPETTVSYDTIYYTETGQKNVTDTQNQKATIIDGKEVTKGDILQYTITTSDIPANRTATVNNFTITDAVPSGITVTSAKIYNYKGEDITDQFTKTINGNTYTFNGANTEMLTAMNLNKGEAYKMPYLVITGVVNADGAELKNTALVHINDSRVNTNTTVNNTGTYNPTKSETANGGSEDANGKVLQRGDTINYKVIADYKDLTTATAISDTQKAKGLSIYDTYDPQTTAVQSTLKLTTANGTVVPSSAYKTTWNTANHKVTITWNSVDDFIKNYGGQTINVTFDATINSDAKDAQTIKNTAYQNNFGQTYLTNTVTNTIVVPDEKKKETEDGGKEDTNGKIAQPGTTINYSYNMDLDGITASNTLADQRAKEISVVDDYDAKTTATQSSLKVTDAKGNVIDNSNFNITWDTKNSKVTIAVKDVAAFLQKYGNQNLQVTFDAVVNQDVKTGETINNQVDLNLFNHAYPSNVVSNITVKPNPTKTVNENGGTESADNKLVQTDDTLNYHVTFDLTNITATNTTSKMQAKGLGLTDTYDSRTNPVQSSITLTDKDGKAVSSSLYTVKWDTTNHTVTLSANDPVTFLKTYGNQVLTMSFNAKAASDVKDGDEIKNTAYQNTFGYSYKTNTVTNRVDKPTPTKSETVDGNTEDGNGTEILRGDTINYKVTWDLSSVTSDTVNDE